MIEKHRRGMLGIKLRKKRNGETISLQTYELTRVTCRLVSTLKIFKHFLNVFMLKSQQKNKHIKLLSL